MSANERAETAFSRWFALVQLLVLTSLIVCGFCGTYADYWYYQDAVPDEALYRAIIQRVRGGENYYDVAPEVLPLASSVFNTRFPTYAWLLALAPNLAWGRVAYLVLSFVICLVSVRVVLANAPLWMSALALTWLLGSTFAWCFYSDAFLTTEPWVGIFLLGSVTAYAKDRWLLGVAFGVAALALRELALPYLFVCAAFAAHDKRWREVACWTGVLAVFAAFLGWHASQVMARSTDVAITDLDNWPFFPGYPYALCTARMCVFIWPLPMAVSIVLIPLAFLGLWTWSTPTGRRVCATVACFFAAFCVVHGGDYWGLIYCPLLGFGLARAPLALRSLTLACLGYGSYAPK